MNKIFLFLVHSASINNVCVRVIFNENIRLRVQCKCAHAHIKMQVLDILRISWIQKHLILNGTWTRWSSYETGNWYRLKPCLISQNKKCRGYLKTKLIKKISKNAPKLFKHEEIKRERDKKRDRQTNRHIECEFWVDAVDNKVKLKFTLSICRWY